MTAAKNVRARMGLSDVPADWSYDQRVAYNKALAAEIQNYSQSFTPAILATAATVSGKNYTSLEDASFAWGDFAAEAGLNLGGFTKNLLYLAALGAGVALVIYYRNRRAAA